MPPSLTQLDSVFVTIILATLGIALPILFVLSVRFLWDRNLSLGRSKELEKLIWQLHRIASAMEHQMHLSFPAVQPGTEEPGDIAYLQPVSPRPAAAPESVATPSAAAPAAHPTKAEPQPVAPPAAAEEAADRPLVTREPGAEGPRGGVNSMFGF